jgi:methylenetetrahydrofolate reductase (NADPH)
MAPFTAGRRGFGSSPPRVSFEFFPPKTPEMEARLWQSVQRLAPLQPDFVSVTYGAGGSTRQRTHAVVERVRRETDLEPAAHLTCVAAPRCDVDDIAAKYWEMGVRHIVALRGDAPDGDAYRAHPRGYRNAADLVAGLKRVADFEISVAAYPEVHPDASSAQADLDNLRRKIDAGAGRAITQYFFDPEVFLRFRDRVAAAGIAVPLVPGILPVTNFAQVVRFSRGCGAGVPAWLSRLFDGLDEDPEQRKLVAATLAAELCHRLQDEGVDEFHFYTLNRSELTRAICRLLGICVPVSAGDCADAGRPAARAV